jgi:hypothetical protein
MVELRNYNLGDACVAGYCVIYRTELIEFVAMGSRAQRPNTIFFRDLLMYTPDRSVCQQVE